MDKIIVGRKNRILSAAAVCALLFFVAARAQNTTAPANGNTASNANVQSEKSGDLMRAINLSPEQQAQLKVIGQQNRAEWQAAGQRLRRASLALDEAIYADTVNEALIEERMREFVAAQAEVARLRKLRELSVRRVMTPEQLATFRNLYQQALIANAAKRRRQVEQQKLEQQQRRAQKMNAANANGELRQRAPLNNR